MDLGEIIRTLGPTVIALGPHVRRAALYMFHNRARGAEYDRHFRELLAYARQDVRAMDDNLRDVLLLCEEFGIDPNQEGSLTRINVRLDWYLSIRQRRVLKKI